MRKFVIEAVRGGQPFPYTMANGDKFDSIMRVFMDGALITTANYVNTDPSLNAKYYGILAEGDYKFICGRRQDVVTHPKVLYIYKATPERDEEILRSSNLTDDDRLLPSIIPNPNHNMEKKISSVLVHNKATLSDGSLGCLTVNGFDAFISYFCIGDKGEFILRREPTWVPDERYLTI